MSSQNDETKEIATLLLESKRFKVNKKQLIDKSRYFAMLLSTNYSDHHLSEHIINYEIPVVSFQDFINWIENNKYTEKFERNYLGRLLMLLELSVLFAVDDLIENIMEILEKNYLLPHDVLNIWLLAQELGLSTLRDLCFAVCLDRFTELPKNLIYKLSRHNFLKLVGNSNLRIPSERSVSYLIHIAKEWMQINEDTIPLDILEKTGPKVYSSIISCNNSNSSVVNSEFYIHCWDGDKLFKLTTFTYPEIIFNNKNGIAGTQFAMRGHNLYLSGGEYGIGTGRFNVFIWRYSLITKKWFYETRMPNARRHMIATFLQNKLLLAGGVGHYRRKLQTVDVYNIHEGVWFGGAEMPMEFVTPPDYYVLDKKLIIYQYDVQLRTLPSVYIYSIEFNIWIKVPIQTDNELQLNIRELCETTPIKFRAASCYIDSKKPNRINLKTIIITCDNLKSRREIYKKVNFLRINNKDVSQVYFFLTSLRNDLYKNKVLICTKSHNYVLLCLEAKKEKLQWHNISIQNQDKFRSLSSDSGTIFLNLMDPANLYAMSTNLECTT